MNISRKTIKTLIVVVIILTASLMVISAISPSYYEGGNLEFPIGAGVVQITNHSDNLPVQLISSSSRVFRISSSSEELSVASNRQNKDVNGILQLLEFELPSGMTEFTVSGNDNVRFVANTVLSLDATVYPLSADEMNTRLIFLGVFVLGLLFYISKLYDHLWISAARRQNARDDVAAQKIEQDNFDQRMKNLGSKNK